MDGDVWRAAGAIKHDKAAQVVRDSLGTGWPGCLRQEGLGTLWASPLPGSSWADLCLCAGSGGAP